MSDIVREKVPSIMAWIDKTIGSFSEVAVPVSSFGFARLPLYFPSRFLDETSVVVVDHVPVIPLSALGLTMFSGFENASYKGITYRDTYFMESGNAAFESVHFHELVHVAQWSLMGAEGFISAYAAGFLASGYYGNPLEEMAYRHQQRFIQSRDPYPVLDAIAGETKLLPPR